MGLIYTHGNGLLSLVLPLLVSHVGFNNLNRWNTSSSSISESASTFTTTTTASQPKSVGNLARLFTRNRSDTMELPQMLELSDAESVATVEAKKTSSSGLFKRSTKSRLKLLSKQKHPELTVQTSGHHGIRIPKKILSSGRDDLPHNTALDGPVQRKVSGTTSPAQTLHNLFHRSHFHGKLDIGSQRAGILDSSSDAVQFPLLPAKNPNRTAVSLSLQSLNLMITDILFAIVYRFTDPDYMASMGQDDRTGDHNTVGGSAGNASTGSESLSDFTRKMKMPADQYLQHKLGRTHDEKISRLHEDLNSITRVELNYSIGLGSNVGFSGLGISTDSADFYVSRYVFEFSKNNAPFLVPLLKVCRPLFSRSRQHALSTGVKHSYIGIAMEDVTRFVDDVFSRSILGNATNLPTQNSVSPSAGGGGSSVLGHTSRVATSGSGLEKGARKLKSHRSGSTSIQAGMSSVSLREISELGQDVNSGIDDWGSPRQPALDDFAVRELYQDLVTFCFLLLTYYNDDSRKLLETPTSNEWQVLYDMWCYFNERIRFLVCGIFYSIERHFDEWALDNAPAIRIDNIILLAFRDAVVIPMLSRCRMDFLPEQIQKQSKELAEMGLLGNIIECFGIIDVSTVDEHGNGDGEKDQRTMLFRDTFSALTA